MRSVIFFYSGEFNGPSPGAKRLALYKKGLENVGVEVLSISTFRSSKQTLFSYFNLFWSPFFAFFKVLRLTHDGDLIFVYGYGWVGLLMIRIGTYMKDKKMVVELNEKPTTVEGNILTNLQVVKTINLFFYKRIIFRLVDGLIVISEQLEKFVFPYLSKQGRILIVPILIDSTFKPNQNKTPICQHPFIFHAGALSERKDGISEVFEAFALVCNWLNGDFHFYYTDRMAYADQLLKIDTIVKKNNLENNVHFVGRLSEEDLEIYQQQCSMLILNKPDNEQNRYNFSTKLGEFLRFSKPVIFTPVGYMSHYLKNGVNAFEVPVNRSDLLAEKMFYVLNNSDLSKEVAKKGQLLIESDFNFALHGKRIKLFFEKIINDN